MINYAADCPALKQKVEKVLDLCKELGISIGHEDSQGAFIIREWNKPDADWLRQAIDERRSTDA